MRAQNESNNFSTSGYGGRSLTWGGITLRLADEDFEASKEEEYNLEWPISYKDLESHYSEIESFLKIYGNKDDLNQLPDGEYIGKIYLEVKKRPHYVVWKTKNLNENKQIDNLDSNDTNIPND